MNKKVESPKVSKTFSVDQEDYETFIEMCKQDDYKTPSEYIRKWIAQFIERNAKKE